MPPQLRQPQPGLGAVTQPQGNPGNMAAGISAVRNGVQMLQKALDVIPVGSELHADVLKALTNLSKHMEAGQSATPALDQQQMLMAAKAAAAQQPMNALQRMFPQAPNQPPAGMPGAGGGGMPPMMPSGGPPPGGG